MPLPPEVQKTINAIDRKIRALEDTKRRLYETFDDPMPPRVSPNINGNNRLTPPPKPSDTSITPSSQVATVLPSADRLFLFLRNNGPATRKEILDKSGVPDGSLSYLLKNGKFRQREDQKWEVIG